MFRKVIFWLHLIAGVVAGVVILIMSVTGTALAFEKEIIAWADRDARRITPPAANSERMPLEALLSKVREAQPEMRPSGATLFADPTIATLVSAGRTNSFYVNSFTGEVKPQTASGVREFMHVMTDWHRFLGAHGESRTTGKAITGACNVAFLFLAISGVYLWWPKKWSASAVRAVTVFKVSLRGKARDWNWHNVIGFWSAPVLIVLTATAMPISYRWAGDLIYKLTGTELPAQGTGGGPGGPGLAGPPVAVPTPPEGAKPLPYQALVANVQKESPRWEQITLRLGAGGGRGGRGGGAGGAPQGEGRGGRRPDEGGERREAPAAPSGPQAVTFTVREAGTWPRTATTTYSFDPFTGSVLRREGFADLNRARQVRSWTRFLHTGEALGKGGQLVAGVASFGGAVLVWTGFALAFRRFFKRKPKNGSTVSESVDAEHVAASARP